MTVKKPTTNPTTPGKTITEIDLLGPPPRKSHLKFPPAGSDLVIPPTLFLYTSPTPTSAAPLEESKSKGKGKGKGKSSASKAASKSARSKKSKSLEEGLSQIKDELSLGGLNPKSQAAEMRGLMTRSIVLHEFNHKEGRIWDESSGSPQEVADDRIRISAVKEGSDLGNENEEEGRIIEEWLSEILAR